MSMLPDPILAGSGPLYDEIVAALKTVYDPEIPCDVYEIGLIYRVEIEAENTVHIEMTLTAPNCPAAESMPQEVRHKVGDIGWVDAVDFELVWDPPWHPDMMTEAAKLELGFL